MAITYYSGVNMTQSDYEDWLIRRGNLYLTSQGLTNITTAPLQDFKDNTHEDDNLILSSMNIGSIRHWPTLRQFSIQTISLAKTGVKLTPNTGRYCLVRIPCKRSDDDTYGAYCWMLIGTDTTLICDYHSETAFYRKKFDLNYDLSGNYTSTSAVSEVSQSWHGTDLEHCRSASQITNVVSRYTMETEYSDKLRELLQHGADRTGQNGYTIPASLTNGVWSYGLPNTIPDTLSFYLMSLEKAPDWMPVFYLDEGIAAIIDYLDRGDDSGRKDPFDPENPPPVEITNFESNHTLYISNAENKTDIHFSVQGYNQEFYDYIDAFRGSYAEYAWNWSTGAGSSTSKIGQAYMGNPVVSWTMPKLSSGLTKSFLFYFAEYPATFNPDSGTSEKASGGFIVNLSYKASSEYKLSVSSVKWINLSTGLESNVPRSVITDGYRYTYGNEHIDILFRAIGLGDLGDIADDGYINDSDEEDDSHGSDQTFTVGNGFGTYYITSTAFDTINETLWYGSWSLTDKADPVQAILSCKSIPFDNTSGTPSNVFLASKNTDVTANKVNPVKSYTFTSLKIGPFRGDFTDIYYTRVHIFLPFIGWKDLPASEVVSRAGRPDVGIAGQTKTLGFKYLVDFISGDCRCIITINGTERYYFDGNCGADVPMTSNNHSIAESRAALGAVGTAISVVGAVASAASGNFVGAGVGALGAVASLSSAIPQYTYTASASPSGYIEASMNRNIMVVVEKPIVQEPESYAHKVGKPCMRNLSLGTLRGYTKCMNADTSSINCTDEEHRMLEDLLNTGVYL